MGDKGIYYITNEGDLPIWAAASVSWSDLARMEVKDTVDVARMPHQVVNSIAFHGDSIYAATSRASLQPGGGRPICRLHQLAQKAGRPECERCVLYRPLGGKVLVNHKGSTDPTALLDTTYYYDSGWHVMTAIQGNSNMNMHISRDGSTLTVSQLTGAAVQHGLERDLPMPTKPPEMPPWDQWTPSGVRTAACGWQQAPMALSALGGMAT
ncbi:MAG: hypothetical protein IPF78_11185 [Flavobacteriales bacterium]|nr:hypothetical protein [Flavobacteriales bacterium]